MPPYEMREPTFLVLASLADGRKHGYAIIKDAEVLSDSRVTLAVGTLYAALERLSALGWVVPAGDEAVDGRLRRYYELTDAGAAALLAETERQRANSDRARARLRSRALRLGSPRPGTAQ